MRFIRIRRIEIWFLTMTYSHKHEWNTVFRSKDNNGAECKLATIAVNTGDNPSMWLAIGNDGKDIDVKAARELATALTLAADVAEKEKG